MESEPFVKSPAFQIYPADFLADANTLVMSAAEVGAYWLLICVCWRENGLPDDLEELAGLARTPLKTFQVSWEKRLKRCFLQREDGKWTHKRLQKERDTQIANREKRQEAGAKGAGQRWQKDSNAKAEPSPKPNKKMTPTKSSDSKPIANDSLSSSSSTSSTTTTLKKEKEPSAFAEFMKFLSHKIGPIPNPGKEGKAVAWLIENGYDFVKCCQCYESLAGEAWRTSTITWTTVKAEIGGWTSKGQVDNAASRSGNGHQTANERRDADFRGYASVVTKLREQSSGTVDETLRRKSLPS